VERIGSYRIVESIGQGSTSHVYKGYDEALQRFVAVKTIVPAQGDETLRKRFEREAQAAAGLAHPRIVTVYDYGQQDDRLYMAMELLGGCDLKQGLAEGRLEPLEDKLEVMAQICDGLGFAHAQGVVHRDLKPANIRLLPDRQVKILDFGLARVSGSDMTRTGLVVGTPHYMSPEQVRGEHVDARSDVFGLGCLFYEILTRARPFEADSLHAVFYRILQSEPPLPSERVPGLPRVLDQVIRRALAKSRDDRFTDAAAMGGALSQAREAIAAGRGGELLPGLEAPPSQPAPTPARAPLPDPSPPELGARPHRALGLGLVALVAALGLTSWGILRGLGREAGPPPASAARDSGEGAALSADIVNTRIALARRRLEAADYKGAVREVEEALRFDPANAAAREVLAQARTLDGRVDKAVMEVRASLAGGDFPRAAQAFWDLLEIAPQHKAAVELGPELESAFADRSADARRIMAEARRSAEARGAQGHERYREGVAFVSAAEEAIQTKAFASAAREFLKAAGAFARAEPIAR
jgi:tRNA A-37 threonylcarbamoyl transferase component Bud32/tetratricopeptide (TPR) repeat protein